MSMPPYKRAEQLITIFNAVESMRWVTGDSVTEFEYETVKTVLSSVQLDAYNTAFFFTASRGLAHAPNMENFIGSTETVIPQNTTQIANAMCAHILIMQALQLHEFYEISRDAGMPYVVTAGCGLYYGAPIFDVMLVNEVREYTGCVYNDLTHADSTHALIAALHKVIRHADILCSRVRTAITRCNDFKTLNKTESRYVMSNCMQTSYKRTYGLLSDRHVASMIPVIGNEITSFQEITQHATDCHYLLNADGVPFDRERMEQAGTVLKYILKRKLNTEEGRIQLHAVADTCAGVLPNVNGVNPHTLKNAAGARDTEGFVSGEVSALRARVGNRVAVCDILCRRIMERTCVVDYISWAMLQRHADLVLFMYKYELSESRDKLSCLASMLDFSTVCDAYAVRGILAANTDMLDVPTIAEANDVAEGVIHADYEAEMIIRAGIESILQE